MAIGLLGAAARSTTGTTTVYTAPAGISHAVVHIDAYGPIGITNVASSFSVSAGGVTLWSGYSTSVSGSPYYQSPSPHWSMMLSPGDTVVLNTVGTILATAAVSGYEVA
jgi:hypothetical protein